METPTCSRWPELPNDILRSVFQRLSFVYFHRAKTVCQNWYVCSKQTLPKKNTSPWLILFPEDGDCALYNAEEAKVYKTKKDLSGIRFLANSGNWFLVLDSKSDLYIIDLFSEKRIDLPPLVSIKGDHDFKLKRVGCNKFKQSRYHTLIIQNAKDLRGLLWVDEKKEEYVVVWYFANNYTAIRYLAFCKNREDHYREIPTCVELPRISDMVLRGGDSLYVLTIRQYVLKLDLLGQEGFKDVTKNDDDMSLPFLLPCPPRDFKCTFDAKRSSVNIVVTTSGEVLFVMSFFFESTRSTIFRVYKKDPNPHSDNFYYRLVEVDSLGDEALLLDLGIIVHANITLGIEPNSIYFTRHDRVSYLKHSSPEICVFNLATNTIKRCFFPGLSNFRRLKDARWFLPS